MDDKPEEKRHDHQDPFRFAAPAGSRGLPAHPSASRRGFPPRPTRSARPFTAGWRSRPTSPLAARPSRCAPTPCCSAPVKATSDFIGTSSVPTVDTAATGVVVLTGDNVFHATDGGDFFTKDAIVLNTA